MGFWSFIVRCSLADVGVRICEKRRFVMKKEKIIVGIYLGNG